MILAPPACEKKRKFSRKRAATNAAECERLTGEPFEHYHCAVHHCWHIGHPRGWKNERLEELEVIESGPLAGCRPMRSREMHLRIH